MIDGCGREIDHLRLSLTDRCNLACKYCVPEGFKPSQSASKGIDPDFAFETVRWLSERHGIRHVRLTGGEPLLCVGLIPLLERISGLKELAEVTLTTNAQALRSKARPLFEAGLERINISLDTLDPQRFAQLTRGGDIVHTLSGIEAAIDVGLTPVKINVVAQRGLNEDELLPIAEWGLARGCVVRYLEVMPLGPLLHVTDQHLVPASEILERLSERLDIREIPQPIGQPATDYAVKGRDVSGVIGIIAHTTLPFCSRCRRLRLTAVGEIVPCLHDSRRFDLMPHWNGRSLDIDAADALLREAVEGKAAVGPGAQSLTMLSLGG